LRAGPDLGAHPANLALRFALELAALVAIGRWGWTLVGAGPWRVVLAVAAPLVAMTAWGLFAVPGDPSRSGRAPVPVPGVVRLLLEAAFFGAATWAAARERPAWAIGFGALLVAHYALSFDRLAWLCRRRPVAAPAQRD
jgi:hypothetical protein